jgi:hypothetical protein
MEPEHRHMPTLHSSFHESEDEEHMVYKATCFGPSAILLYNSFDGNVGKARLGNGHDSHYSLQAYV